MVGTYLALSKPLVELMPIFLIAWLRFGLGALAMLSWIRKPSDEIPMTWDTKKLLFFESFLGNFLFTLFVLFGIRHTSAVSAGIILSAIPATIAIMSWFFLKEKVSLRIWFAIAFAVIGVALLSYEPNSTKSNSWFGNFLLIGAVLCESAYAVIGKYLTSKLNPKRIASLINLWGLILTTPAGFYIALNFDFSVLSLSKWYLFIYYALSASVITVWLWMTGLKHVSSSTAGVFTVMLPISAASIGIIFLGENMSSLQMLAFGMALLGIILVTFGKASTPE